MYDTDDQRRLMKSILKELDISEKNITPKSILNEISRAKDSLISPAAVSYTHLAKTENAIMQTATPVTSTVLNAVFSRLFSMRTPAEKMRYTTHT